MARIAILTTPEGHFSIATAIKEVLLAKHAVKVLSIRDSSFNVYTPIYQFFPTIFKIPYVFFQQSSMIPVVTSHLRKKLMPPVSAFIESSKPDVIICTNLFFLPALEALSEKNDIPILNVLADPWSIQPSLISSKCHTNLVFDEKTLSICQKINLEARYDISGWFVRRTFYESSNTRAVQKKLKLNRNLSTITIVAGSEGTMMILKLIPALMQLKKPVNAIILCGNNKHLFNSVKSIIQVLKAVSNTSRIIPISYKANIAPYIAVADVVVGKAGPNTIFESVAAKKPFIAITHITGQEDGNLDLIKAYQLGFVEENGIKIIKLLQAVLDNPARLRKLNIPISKLSNRNQLAGDKLLKIIDQLVKKSP